MNKKILIATFLIVTILIGANLQVTKSPVRAALYTTEADQLDQAANKQVEFTINIRFRLRLPSFGAGVEQ